MRSMALLLGIAASLAATCDALHADTIETFGGATARVVPDRLFLEVDFGVVGGEQFAATTVETRDLNRALARIRAADVRASIVRTTIRQPDARELENPIIDRRAFGAILLRVERPNTISKHYAATALERAFADGRLRPGIFAEIGPQTYGIDDCDAARATARLLAVEHARNAAAQVYARVFSTSPIALTQASVIDVDAPSQQWVTTGYVCGADAEPPMVPPQMRGQYGSFGLADFADVPMTVDTRWNTTFVATKPAASMMESLTSAQYAVPQDLRDEEPGTIRTSALVYDDTKLLNYSAADLEIALARDRATRIASGLGIAIDRIATLFDFAVADPTALKIPRFFDHDGTSLSVGFHIASVPNGERKTLHVTGTSDERIPADRTRVVVVLDTTATQDLVDRVTRLSANVGRRSTFRSTGTNLIGVIDTPTSVGLAAFRAALSALPELGGREGHIYMTGAVDDCSSAQMRALDRAVANAKARAVALAGASLREPLSAVDRSGAYGSGSCGPNVIANLPYPFPFSSDTGDPATVRETSSVAVTYAVAP